MVETQENCLTPQNGWSSHLHQKTKEDTGDAESIMGGYYEKHSKPG